MSQANEECRSESTSVIDAVETRTDRRRRQTHRSLLDAGVSVIATHGLAKVTISSITEAADVALGSFYNHFQDRNQYLRVLSVENLIEWLDEVRAARLSDFTTQAHRVAAAAVMVVRKATREPTWGIFISEVLAHPDITGDSELTEVVIPTIEHGIEDGCFTLSNPQLGARLLIGMTRQSLLYLREAQTDHDLEAVLATTMLRTLGTDPNLIDGVVEETVAQLASD